MKSSFKSLLYILVVASLCATTNDVFSQKPKWIGNTPKELNHTYKFVEVFSTGTSLASARADAKDRLVDDTQLQEGIKIYRNTRQQTTIDKKRVDGGKLNETVRSHITVDMTIDGEKYHLQAIKVDEYAEHKNGLYNLYSLYMVALCDAPVFDRVYLSTSYGFTPVVLSIVPGAGQWYKGSKTKGICIFSACALSIAGIIICDNERASYVKKAVEQPKFVKEYSSKADNWETGRNICIGAAAGIWLYNIIDAAVAKGSKRVIINRADRSGLSINPMIHTEGLGVSFAYRF